MSDFDDDEVVRGMVGKKRSFLVGAAVVLALCAAIAVLLVPIIAQPSVRTTLPKVLLIEGEVRRIPPVQIVDPLREWVNTFTARLTLREYMPRGAAIVASQTAALLYTSDNGYSATGLVFQDGIVISAAHLLDAGMSGARMYASCHGRTEEGEVIFHDRMLDVLVVAAPHCSGVALRLSERRIRGNEALYKTGFTFNPPDADVRAERYFAQVALEPTADKDSGACDDCSSVFKESVRRARVPMLKAITGLTIKGHSGSPVCLANGDIVGMIVQLDENHPRGYMVPASSIARALRHIGLAK